MKGKRVRQINNLVITKADTMYMVWTPFDKLIYTATDLNDVVKKCNACTTYLKKKSINNALIEKTGTELKQYIENTRYTDLEERDFVSCVYHYLTKSHSNRVLSISGLRGTGKTTGILQAIARLNDYDNTVFLSINAGANINSQDLCLLINRKYSNKKYIIIDEITRVTGMIEGVSFLSDNYCMSGKRVVISGTDSFALDLVSNASLYHRVINKNVTFVSYAETKRTLGLSVSEYIDYGGLFTFDKLRDVEDAYRYTQTAIIDNILNTIRHNKSNSGVMLLRNVDDLTIRNVVFRILYAIVYSHYTDRVNFQRVLNSYDKKEVTLYGIETLNQLLADSLGLDIDLVVPRNIVLEVLKIMERIGVVVSTSNIINKTDRNYWITNPSLYNQLMKSLNDIMGEESLTISNNRNNSFAGLLFEAMIVTHTIRFSKEQGLNTYFYHKENEEIDLIVEKLSEDSRIRYLGLYEIKLQPNSDYIVSTRLKWLNNIETINNIKTYGKIICKGVLYNGKDKVFNGYEDRNIYKKIVDAKEKEVLNKGTRFIGAERYLLNLKSELNTLLNQ